jgi:hypothetical protein
VPLTAGELERHGLERDAPEAADADQRDHPVRLPRRMRHQE